jgi:hypothetical protein
MVSEHPRNMSQSCPLFILTQGDTDGDSLGEPGSMASQSELLVILKDMRLYCICDK